MIGLIALLWLTLVACAGLWVIAKLPALLKAPTSIASWWAFAPPVATLIFLTWPLIGQPIFDNMECARAGLTLSKPIDARDKGVYWRSHAPQPNSYSNGFNIGSDPERQALAGSLVRALVEGRIAFIEIPYKPVRDSGSHVPTNQKLTYTNRVNARSECLSMKNVGVVLPLNTCITWEETVGIASRYEVRGAFPGMRLGRSIAIHDRVKKIDVARYHYANSHNSEFIGVKLPTPSCTKDKFDHLPYFNILAMQFVDVEDKTVAREQLSKFAKTTWTAIEPR